MNRKLMTLFAVISVLAFTLTACKTTSGHKCELDAAGKSKCCPVKAKSCCPGH